MKTFSGKEYIVDESILGSVNAGRKPMIETFLNDTLRSQYYTLNQDLSVTLKIDVFTFKNRQTIPCWFDSVNEITFENCKMKEFVLPRKAKKIVFDRCSDLTKVTTKEKSEIDLLIFQDCDNLDLSGLKDAYIKQIKIYKCGITTLCGLEKVSKTIYIKRCSKLKTYDLKNEYGCATTIIKCPIKSCSEPINSRNIVFSDLSKAKSIEIKIGQVTDFRIEDCEDIQSLVISGNKADTITIDNLPNLKDVKTTDCNDTLSFNNLDSIESYSLPTITGYCVFDAVKYVPDVQCKKLIVRN